jgi:hypothetical protein
MRPYHHRHEEEAHLHLAPTVFVDAHLLRVDIIAHFAHAVNGGVERRCVALLRTNRKEPSKNCA